MSPFLKKVPLGAVLQQAGLISTKNITEALQQQREDVKARRIGEILADQGHLNSKTVDFFADSWPTLIQERPTQPIGQYFRQAALLDEEQITEIVNQQKESKLKFGEQAVAKGLLNQTTVDFFLKHLVRESQMQSKEKTIKQLEYKKSQSSEQVQDSFYKIKLKLLNLEDKDDYGETVLDRVLSWTGGHSLLTQKLSKLIAQNKDKVVPGKETEQVDYLVKTKILQNWRNQETGTHLQSIEAKLVNNQHIEPDSLFRLYRQVLTAKVSLNSTQVQKELIKTGLVVKQQDHLAVANLIYKSVFNSVWIEQKLTQLDSQDNNNLKAVTFPAKSREYSISQSEKFQKYSLKNLLILLALIALLLVFFDSISKRIKVRKSFKQANEFLKKKSFDQAIAEYNKILNIDSNYFQAWTNRGYALAGLQNYDEMRESCHTATIINPKAVYAWNCKGEALHNLKRQAEAIRAFDQAIALNQTDPIFLINKSESLKAIGEEQESLVTIAQAIKVLEQVEAVNGKDKVRGEFAVALTFLGNGYRKNEQYEPAIFNYNRALEYSPNYFPAKIGKGIILNRVKRYIEAQEEFESILENKQLSKTQQAQTLFYLGKTLCQSQQNIKSVAAFEQAIELKPDYQAAKQAIENCR